VTGKVNFFLVKIKLKYMELAIIKKEVIGAGRR
jgi:vacuolar protein sorting-associated protein 26